MKKLCLIVCTTVMAVHGMDAQAHDDAGRHPAPETQNPMPLKMSWVRENLTRAIICIRPFRSQISGYYSSL